MNLLFHENASELGVLDSGDRPKIGEPMTLEGFERLVVSEVYQAQSDLTLAILQPLDKSDESGKADEGDEGEEPVIEPKMALQINLDESGKPVPDAPWSLIAAGKPTVEGEYLQKLGLLVDGERYCYTLNPSTWRAKRIEVLECGEDSVYRAIHLCHVVDESLVPAA